jgi:hypothetical protein
MHGCIVGKTTSENVLPTAPQLCASAIFTFNEREWPRGRRTSLNIHVSASDGGEDDRSATNVSASKWLFILASNLVDASVSVTSLARGSC